MADGCVLDGRTPNSQRAIYLGLSLIDSEHLRSFQSFIGSRKKLSYSHCEPSAPAVSLSITSDRIANALISFGVAPRKSKTAKVHKLENNRHFWRGVIDGDGSLILCTHGKKLYATLQLVGSYTLLAQFLAFCKTIHPTCAVHVTPHKGIYKVAFLGCYVRKIIHTLYGNCSVALPRKLRKAEEIINLPVLHQIYKSKCVHCSHPPAPNRKHCEQCLEIYRKSSKRHTQRQSPSPG